jgi:hypothetical protein
MTTEPIHLVTQGLYFVREQACTECGEVVEVSSYRLRTTSFLRAACPRNKLRPHNPASILVTADFARVTCELCKATRVLRLMFDSDCDRYFGEHADDEDAA